MTLRVSGKNVDIGESLRGHAEARVGEALAKYFSGTFKKSEEHTSELQSH